MSKYTLSDAKNEIAVKNGYKNFKDVKNIEVNPKNAKIFFRIIEEAAELYASKVAIEFAEWIKKEKWLIVTNYLNNLKTNHNEIPIF